MGMAEAEPSARAAARITMDVKRMVRFVPAVDRSVGVRVVDRGRGAGEGRGQRCRWWVLTAGVEDRGRQQSRYRGRRRRRETVWVERICQIVEEGKSTGF